MSQGLEFNLFPLPPSLKKKDFPPTKQKKSFSITSPGIPDADFEGEQVISIAVKKTKDPIVSYIHDQLQIGEEIEIRGPGGKIYFDPDRDPKKYNHIVCIAGGIG